MREEKEQSHKREKYKAHPNSSHLVSQTTRVIFPHCTGTNEINIDS